jgi:transcriptional regulator with XRE-family HTH domain
MVEASKRLRRFLDGPPKRTQEEFAEEIGASQGSVSSWLRAVKAPGRVFALAIEAVTGIKASSWPKAKPKSPAQGKAA